MTALHAKEALERVVRRAHTRECLGSVGGELAQPLSQWGLIVREYDGRTEIDLCTRADLEAKIESLIALEDELEESWRSVLANVRAHPDELPALIVDERAVRLELGRWSPERAGILWGGTA